jgi:hypothetical protein
MFVKPNRLVDRVFVHCSASDNPDHDNAATIRKWHVEDNDWSDIGYHYFIRKDGTLEDGRPLERTPAAQKNHNTGTIAICLSGLAEENFTLAQFATLKALALEINNAYGGALTFHGHREVASKACPVFDYKSVLMLDGFGRLGLPGASEVPLAADTAPAAGALPTLTRGARGPAVARMQKLLLIKDDGVFGPRTEAAVRDFQSSKGLQRTGVVDVVTWTALMQNDRVEHSG